MHKRKAINAVVSYYVHEFSDQESLASFSRGVSNHDSSGNFTRNMG